jgi:hypothetical protein
MKVEIKSSSYNKHQTLLATSLLVVLLVSSLFVGTFMNEANGASLENAIHVKNEEKLKNVISNTPSKRTVIALDNDIALTEALKIPANKDITLTSNKIIGAEGKSTIFVDGGGVLRLDGIVVTHVNYAGAVGGGVYVDVNGLLIMYSGEISGNTVVGGGHFTIGTLLVVECLI